MLLKSNTMLDDACSATLERWRKKNPRFSRLCWRNVIAQPIKRHSLLRQKCSHEVRPGSNVALSSCRTLLKQKIIRWLLLIQLSSIRRKRDVWTGSKRSTKSLGRRVRGNTREGPHPLFSCASPRVLILPAHGSLAKVGILVQIMSICTKLFHFRFLFVWSPYRRARNRR